MTKIKQDYKDESRRNNEHSMVKESLGESKKEMEDDKEEGK